MDTIIHKVNATPIPGPVFLKLSGIAMKALAGKRRVIPPMEERCIEDLAPGAIVLTDHPLNQMGMSIVRECRGLVPQDKAGDIAMSFLIRLDALAKLIDCGALQELAIQEEGGWRVHDVVLRVAAECPLELDGSGYASASFLDRVRGRIASEGNT